MARIEAEGLCIRISWWQRLFPELDAKPVLACAYGLVIMGLLSIGVGVSQSLDTEEAAASNVGRPWFAQAPASDLVLPASQSSLISTPCLLAACLIRFFIVSTSSLSYFEALSSCWM